MNKKTPSAILTADWHIWDYQPLCRTDDFWHAQINKIKQVKKLQEKYRCPVLHAGDLTERWKASPLLLSTLIKYLPKQFYTVLGNHDLKNHSLELYEETAIECLAQAKALEVFSGHHWEQKEETHYIDIYDRKIILSHEMIWQGTPPWPGCTDPEAKALFKKYPDADLIVTGHNHKTFIAENKKGQILVNPGSLTRHKADQIDHDPCVFFYYADTNEVTKHGLVYEQDVISREHLGLINEKEDRIDAFLQQLNTKYEVQTNFKHNIEKLIQQNNIQGKTKRKIMECIESIA